MPERERGKTSAWIRRALAASRRYGLLIYQLVSNLFRQFPVDTTRIVTASAASLLFQAAALAVLYLYLRALEKSESLLGLAARESPLLFAGFAILILLLFVGFTLLEYRANIATLALCRQYQNIGTQEALSLSSRLPHWFSVENGRHISAGHLKQMLAIDVHHRSRMARVLIMAMIPAARLIFCAVVLLYIDLQFSLLILFAVGIPVAGLYSVGKRVADTMTIRESGSTPIFPRQWELLNENWQRETHINPGELDWETTMGTEESRYRQYFRRLKAKAQGVYLINIANAIGIMVLVLSLGIWILREEGGNWSLWLTYLVALRYFLSSLGSIAKSIVTSTRFMRQTQRFTTFVAAATAAVNSADPASVPAPEQVVEACLGDKAQIVGDDDLDDD